MPVDFSALDTTRPKLRFENEPRPASDFWHARPLNWADKAERWVAHSVPGGDIAIRATEGINRVGENLAAWVSTASGRGDIASKIYAGQRQRDAWLSQIESAGLTQDTLGQLIGERGTRVVMQTAQSLGEQGTVGYLTGGLGVYGYNTTSAFEQALDDGARGGLSGGELLTYAAGQGVYEGAIMFLMGRAGKKLGIDTLEESFSPVSRNAVRAFMRSPTMKQKMTVLAKELGGMTAEGVEEALTSGGQQLNSIAFGQQDSFDWGEMLEAGAGGVLGRGALSAIGGVKSELKKFEKTLPERVSGIHAARVDIQRGVNPLEVAGIQDNTEFAKQLGRDSVTDMFRESYQDAVNSYVDEMRRDGKLTELKRWEREASKAAEETAQRQRRLAEAGRAGEREGGSLTEFGARQARTRGEWDKFLLTRPAVKADGYGTGTEFAVTEPAGDFVTVYRAVPSNVTAISPGDYVTASREYAEEHLRSTGPRENAALREGGHILSKKIRKSDLGVAAANELIWVPAGEGVTSSDMGKTGESQVTLEQELPERTANDRAVMSAEEFEKRTQSARPEQVTPIPQEVNPLGIPPWESETRLQRKVRTWAQRATIAKQRLSELRTRTDEKRRLTERQQELAHEIVKDNVPAGEQEKFTKRILEAKTPGKVRSFLKAVQKHVDKRLHNLAKRNLKESFRKAKNLRSEFAQQVNEIRESIDMRNFNHSEAAQKLKEKFESIPNTELSPQDAATLEQLSRRPIKDMTAEEINDLAETVERLTYQSEIADKLIGEQFGQTIQETSETIADDVALAPAMEMNGSLVKQLIGQPDNATDRSLISKVWHEAGTRPEATTRGLSRELNDKVYEPLRKARNQASLVFGKILQAHDGFLDSIGLEHDTTSLWSAIKRRFGQPGNQYEAWLQAERTIDGVRLTRQSAYDLVLQLKDPRLRERLEKHGVVFSKSDRTLGPIDAALQSQLEDFVGPEGSALADFQFGMLQSPEVIGAVNDANQQLTGRALTRRLDTVPTPIAERDAVQLLTQSRNGLGQLLLDSYAHLKRRTGSDNPVQLDEDFAGPDRILTHIRRMNHIGAFMVPARNVEAILNNPEVKTAVIAKAGQFGYDQLADAAKTEAVGYRSVEDWERGLSKLNHTLAGAMVGAKITVMAGQPFDALLANAYEPGEFGDLAEGLREYNEAGPNAILAEMRRVLPVNSGEWNHRFETGNYLGEVTQGIYGKTGGYFQSRSLVDHAADSLQQAEMRTAAAINYCAAKNQARRLFGLAQNDRGVYDTDPAWLNSVVDSWDKKTVRGSNSSHPLELSSVLRAARRNPVLGLAFNFYGQAHKVYSLFPAARNEFQRGNYRAAAQFAAAGAASTLVWSAIQQALSLAKKEKEQHGLLANYSHKVVKNLVGLNPAVGLIDSTGLVDAAMGYPMYADSPALLVDTTQRLTTAGVSLTGQIMNGFNRSDDQERFLKNLLEVGTVAGAMFGVPTYGPVDIGKRVARGSLLPGLEGPPPKPFKM